MLREWIKSKREIVLFRTFGIFTIIIGIVACFFFSFHTVYATDTGNVTWEEVFQFIKLVSGNMGDKTKAFSFQLELTSPDENKIPEKLKYSIIDNGVENSEIQTASLNDGVYTFQLKHGEQILFKGIPAGSRYSVKEIDGETSGYTVTSKYAQGIVTGKSEVTFINERNVSIPTIISMNTKKFIAIAGIALFGILFMMRCRGKHGITERRNRTRE